MHNFQICYTSSIDALDSTSTEYSIVGQTSSISTSSNGAISSLGPSDKITTKIYGTITPAPKVQKRTSTISDGKNKVCKLEESFLYHDNFLFLFIEGAGW